MLSDDERGQIIDAIAAWAEMVPDLPVVGFLEHEGGLLRPGELLQEVVEGTPNGEAVLEILEHGVRREGIENVTRRIVTVSGEW